MNQGEVRDRRASLLVRDRIDDQWDRRSGNLQVPSQSANPRRGQFRLLTHIENYRALLRPLGWSACVVAGIEPLRLDLRAQMLSLKPPPHRARGSARRSAGVAGAARRVEPFGETPQRCLAIAQLGSLSGDDDP